MPWTTLTWCYSTMTIWWWTTGGTVAPAVYPLTFMSISGQWEIFSKNNDLCEIWSMFLNHETRICGKTIVSVNNVLFDWKNTCTSFFPPITHIIDNSDWSLLLAYGWDGGTGRLVHHRRRWTLIRWTTIGTKLSEEHISNDLWHLSGT